MKRSEINRYMEEALEFWENLGFRLPPYARWSIDEWEAHAAECKEIFDLQIGWDITAFGSEDFLRTGLSLYTLRNGRLHSAQYPKPYAEKIMMVRENQVTPRHFHWNKQEDFINRGGGNLVIELFKADPQKNRIASGEFIVSVNGMSRTLRSGDRIVLTPGESITIKPFHAHRFYGEKGSGPSMIGEVFMVNDDNDDNCYLDEAVRFDSIAEDQPVRYPLACEYRTLIQAKTSVLQASLNRICS